MATVLMPAVPDHHPDDGQRHRHRGKKPRNWVRWEPPNPGWLKLNTDGASKGNPGLSGGGSILRDPNGNVIFQTFRGYGVQTALVAEFLALTDGIKTFCDLGLMDSGFKLVIESDSTTLIKALCRTIAVPREIMPYWHLLDFLMPFLEGMVDAVHVYREGNTEADYLANRGVMVHQEMMMVNQVLNPTVLFCEGFHSGSRLAAPWNYRISPCLIHNCVHWQKLTNFYSINKKGTISLAKSLQPKGKYEQEYEQSEEFNRTRMAEEKNANEEWRRRKMQMRISEEEGRLKKKDEVEAKEMWKRKQDHEAEWEGTRAKRVSSW